MIVMAVIIVVIFLKLLIILGLEKVGKRGLQMNFKKIEEELRKTGIISIDDSVVNEGQLYKALFGILKEMNILKILIFHRKNFIKN